jgi:hypothetical protein
MLFHFQKKRYAFRKYVCFLLFYFGISQIGYRKLDTLIFEFASPESRKCELVFQFFTQGIDYGKTFNPCLDIIGISHLGIRRGQVFVLTAPIAENSIAFVRTLVDN